MSEYHDVEGNQVSLYKLVRKEPDWAASIIKFSNEKIPELEKRVAELEARLTITPEMIESGARRLVHWEDGCVWPDSWSGLQVAAARNDAERVLRSALSVEVNDGH